MKVRTSDIIGLGLLAFSVVCRFKTSVADFYAERCYPVISSILSRIAALVPFSLEEIVVIWFILVFIIVLVSSIVRKEGFFRILAKTGRVVMWLVVWFDLGWGINYFRTPLYTRLEVEPIHYDSGAFERFLSDYARALNRDAGSLATWDKASLEQKIKDYYATEGAACGYTPVRSWQHVKDPLINPLFSAVTVLGWMGPFFCETQVNLDLPELEYPSVLAHEMAHLAGVTGAEIVPVSINYSRYWSAKSWDGFQIPKPFSKVTLRIGSPIAVPPHLDHDGIEKYRQFVEEELMKITVDQPERRD